MQGIQPIPLAIEAIAKQVVDSAFKVHKTLGPGLLESVYEACLAHELGLRQIELTRQLIVPIWYEGLTLDANLRIDLLVSREVIVEIKAVDALLPIHEAQLLTYLKLTSKRLGLLINFNSALIRDGIRRIAL